MISIKELEKMYEDAKALGEMSRAAEISTALYKRKSEAVMVCANDNASLIEYFDTVEDAIRFVCERADVYLMAPGKKKFNFTLKGGFLMNDSWLVQAVERYRRFPRDLKTWIGTANMCGCGKCFCCFARKHQQEIREASK